MRRRGATLVEVLVTAAVFGLLLGMCGLLVVRYFRAWQGTEAGRPAMRRTAHGLERVAVQLRQTVAVHWPDEPTLRQGYAPIFPSTPPLVVAMEDDDGRHVVGYAWDPSDRSIRRIEYGRPEPLPTTWSYPDFGWQRLGHTGGFRVQLTSESAIPLLSIQVDSTTDSRLPLSTIVRLRSAFP